MTRQTTLRTNVGDDHQTDDGLLTELPLEDLPTDWARLEAITPDEALQNALDDPDAQPLTPDQRLRLRRVPNPENIRLAMGLTQEQFARRFEIAVSTLRDWEQGVRYPDSVAKAYLRVIEQDAEAVVQALERTYRAPANR